MNRIVCVTGRSTDVDSVGRRVYELLSERELPPGVEVVDGGMAGSDRFRPLRKSGRVILVDCVAGDGNPGDVVQVYDRNSVLDHFRQTETSLDPEWQPALLDLLNDGQGPDVVLVCLEPPADSVAVWRATEMCLVMAEREAEPADKPAAFCWSA